MLRICGLQGRLAVVARAGRKGAASPSKEQRSTWIVFPVLRGGGRDYRARGFGLACKRAAGLNGYRLLSNVYTPRGGWTGGLEVKISGKFDNSLVRALYSRTRGVVAATAMTGAARIEKTKRACGDGVRGPPAVQVERGLLLLLLHRERERERIKWIFLLASFWRRVSDTKGGRRLRRINTNDMWTACTSRGCGFSALIIARRRGEGS